MECTAGLVPRTDEEERQQPDQRERSGREAGQSAREGAMPRDGRA
jgi:hypothetical protein